MSTLTLNREIFRTAGTIFTHLNSESFLALFFCSVYNKLKYCVDGWAKASWCRGRGFLVDEVFLRVHETYFSLCGQVIDPPLTTVIMLIAPVVMATLFLPLVCNSLTTYNIEMPGSLGL